MKRAVLLSTLLACLVMAVPDAQAATQSCPTGANFMVGPLMGFELKARGVSCAKARQVARGWGKRRSCISDPSSRSCRVGGWRCRDASAGYETTKIRCTKGKRRAVGFRAGS